MRLEGRVAIVLGGGGGIGTAIATQLSADGAAVAVWDLDGARARQVAEQLSGKSVGIATDITDRSRVEEALADTTSQLGPVDVLVNNAGIDEIGRFLDSEESARALAVSG